MITNSLQFIRVSHGDLFWEQRVTPEVENGFSACFRDTWSSRESEVPGIFLPLRTHRLDHFLIDLFIPILGNHTVLRESFSDNRIGKPEDGEWADLIQTITEVALAILIDLVTLPIRLMTVIPRVIFNACRERHAFALYLESQGCPAELWDKEYLDVKYGDLAIEPANRRFIETTIECRVKLIDLPSQFGSSSGNPRRYLSGTWDPATPDPSLANDKGRFGEHPDLGAKLYQDWATEEKARLDNERARQMARSQGESSKYRIEVMQSLLAALKADE